MRRLALVLAFVGLAVVACSRDVPIGDGAAQACTEIGCANGVTFDVRGVGLAPGRGRVVAKICFDGDCEKVRYTQQRNGGARWDNDRVEMFVDANAVSVTMRLPEGGDFDTTTMHDASLVLRVPGKPKVSVQRQVPLERSQPNGPDCEPVCWQARIEHTA